MEGWQIKLQYEMQFMGFAMYITRIRDGKREFITPTGTVELEPNSAVTKDPLHLYVFQDISELKQLVTEAERNGVVPESTDRALGELKATKTHLDDLRHLLKLPRNKL